MRIWSFVDFYKITLVGISTETKGLKKGGNGVADDQEGPNRREDGDQDGEEGDGVDGQAYDDISEECILDCNVDQFDALVDNVENMICDVWGEEDEMTDVHFELKWGPNLKFWCNIFLVLCTLIVVWILM